MGLEISGLSYITAFLDGLEAAEKKTGEALEQAAVPICEAMVNMAPVGKTRHLRDAIKIGKVRSGSNGKMITIGVHRKDFKGDDYYPAYVEFGHGGPHPAGAHPYARPAFDAKKDEAYQLLKDTLLEATEGRN